MPKTSIEWTDISWPVLNGCRRISPGCQHCYAELLTATRLRNTAKYKGLATYTKNGPRWTGKTRLWRKDLTMPIRLRRPSKIFVCDMGDLFYEGNTDEEIDQVFGVMWACLYLGRHAIPGHIFQVLTKRAKRMRSYLAEDRRKQWAYAAVNHGGGIDPDGVFEQTMQGKDPHPRIWLGVSAEDQERADERIPDLLATPAALRFVSAEPLLGQLDLGVFLTCKTPIDWVIVGGESGNGARECKTEWISILVEDCDDAHVPIFVKQLGSLVRYAAQDSGGAWGPGVRFSEDDDLLKLAARKGNDPTEWPERLRVREFPA